ncbi:hypothetical protein [Clostridium botulinum]|uniref:hypothetical protein n=1 Tax=Clostridium botulinum TaxID=1491 RepID=UPI0017494BC8|nr:hypothetical protein [Clostridium botulinum]MBD5589126.1 hypothetical protein [Clostridium botulinum]MBY6842826.1 hypothetical protein [Clostridium botulinum]
MKNIILLYSCNAWKEHSSMRLVMASTSEKKIRKEINNQIKNKDMEYESNTKDLKELSLNDIDKCLKYGYIFIVEDGERQ